VAAWALSARALRLAVVKTLNGSQGFHTPAEKGARRAVRLVHAKIIVYHEHRRRNGIDNR